MGCNPIRNTDVLGDVPGDPGDPPAKPEGKSFADGLANSYPFHEAVRANLAAFADDPFQAVWDGVKGIATTAADATNYAVGMGSHMLGFDNNMYANQYNSYANASSYDQGVKFGSLTSQIVGGVVAFEGLGIGVGKMPSIQTISAALKFEVGPMKQWIRVGPSYSHNLGMKTTLSIRWGASPAHNGKFLKQIGSSKLRDLNVGLRNSKVPLLGWRAADTGHFHLKK